MYILATAELSITAEHRLLVLRCLPVCSDKSKVFVEYLCNPLLFREEASIVGAALSWPCWVRKWKPSVNLIATDNRITATSSSCYEIMLKIFRIYDFMEGQSDLRTVGGLEPSGQQVLPIPKSLTGHVPNTIYLIIINPIRLLLPISIPLPLFQYHSIPLHFTKILQVILLPE